MDWLRRNWPDLLIGVALVAVIAGIIATLISGGSFFPVGQGARNAGGASTTQSAPVTPNTPAQPGAGLPDPAQPGAAEPSAVGQPTEPAAASEPTTNAQAGTAAATQEPAAPTTSQGGAPIAVLPPSGAPTPTPAGQPAATPQQAAPAVTPVAPSAPAATVTAPPAAPASTAAAGTAAATAAADESSYRVSVGAFGNADNAQRLASTFQAAGYPVLLGTQGNLTIVLVGPYGTEEQARSVAAAIGAGNFDVVDPTVYRYDPSGAGAGAAGQATQAPVTSGAATPAAAQATAPAAAPQATAAAGRYLQVGAYGSRESALPQIERLSGLGFSVTERTEGTLLKLLVGPFEGQSLTSAQERLKAAGIESFAR